jgi:hypothetical protein
MSSTGNVKMTNEGVITIKVHRNGNILKSINEPINFNNKNWTNYTKTLKTTQKNVNVYLTELVEKEKSGGGRKWIKNSYCYYTVIMYIFTEQMNIDEGEGSDSETDESDSLKRKLGTVANKSPKKPKI